MNSSNNLTIEQKIRHILEVNSSIVTERLGDIVVQQLLSLIQEEVDTATPVTIMGKTIDEVLVILSALELERIADMKMTMGRLGDWMKLLREDYRKSMEMAIEKTFDVNRRVRNE